MADEWVERSLGNVIDIRHGFAFKGEFFRDEPPGDVLLTPGNFAIGGGFKSDKFKFYNGPVPDEFVLREGDLLITMTDLSRNADTLGYPAFAPPSSEGRRFLHNQRLGKVVIKAKEAVDLRYLHYLLCSREYRHEIIAGATGTTVKHTSPERIKRFRFLLPPLPEQCAIAHILGMLDDKIELNQQMNETLEAIARVIFKSWFVDFDPVRAKAEGRDPGLPKHLTELFPDSFEESELEEIPKGWGIKTLDQIATFLNGLALQKYPPLGDGDLPVIKIVELRQGHSKGSDWANNNISKEYIVNNGDVLFSWSGSLLVRIWCGDKGALNQHLFKVKSSAYPKWFYYEWVRHHLPDFQAIAEGKATTMGHIQRYHLTAALTVVPNQDVLNAADKVFAPLLDKYISSEIEPRTLADIRDTLLPKLISGEIRIQHVERIIGRNI